MPPRKKHQKGKGKQKREIRQFANATPAEIIKGIHGGKPGAIRALATRVHQQKRFLFNDESASGMTEAILKNLKRCDESLASVFGVPPSGQDMMICLPSFCLSMLFTLAEARNEQDVCFKIVEGISPVVKCMVDERRVFFQNTDAWFNSVHIFIGLILTIISGHQATCMDIIEQDGLLPFLGQAICWSQCRDIVEGFRRSNNTVPHELIISAAHSICAFLLQELQNFGIPVPKACEMLRTIGTFTIAKDSDLPATIGMTRLIRSYRDMCHSRDMSTDLLRNKLADIIATLIWGGCVDEIVMKELAKLCDICPEFVARCTTMILYKHSNVLSDSHFAGALRSGLFATTLSICSQLGSQEIHNPVMVRNEGLESGIRADAVAYGMIGLLHRIRLHHKTHKVLALVSPLNFRGLEDKLEHIFRDARESVCANCLMTFNKDALKWCEGTHMLEPFCSKKCLKESWDAGACADFGDIVEEDEDRRSISLKRTILQAGYKVLQDCIVRTKYEHSQGMARGQGLTISINLMEFPPRVSSGLLPPGVPSDCVQVRFIAEDFRGYRNGVGGRVLVLRKRFAI